MSELERLLRSASEADPGVRIEYRDRIASHGAAAIPALRDWLADARLGAFAVRTLERIGRDDANRSAVLTVFGATHRDAVANHVNRDIARAIGRLGGSRRAGRPKDRRRELDPGDWPGSRIVSAHELRFHDEMLGIFRLAGEATRRRRPDGTTVRGYWASYFLRGVRNHGGPEYARQLLQKTGTTPGFERLAEEGRLDLTVEALVLKPDYAELFTDEERAIARDRLAEAGYQPERD